MPEGPGNGYDGVDRRTGDGRRSGKDRRRSRGGIRGLFPFSLLLDRRSEKDRRTERDRRAGKTEDDRPKATKLGLEPLRLKELAEKSGIPLKRLEQAAAGKVELSAEEHAALRQP